MSRALFQLQNNIKNLRQQLNDRFHLAFLNYQSYLCVKSACNKPFKEISSNLPSGSEQSPQNPIKTTNPQQKPTQIHQTTNKLQLNTIIQTKLNNLSQIFQKRSQNHLNYLIIKQIQGEQECVRRDRLTEYEEKIYDQRRLISDKEVFTQSLLRPKKQRPQNMTSEQFQEVRALEKMEEEKEKIVALEEEVKNLIGFRKKICDFQPKNINGITHGMLLKKRMQMCEKIKSNDLQKTKANSLETVNTSNMINICEKPQKPFEEQDFNSQIRANSQKDVKGSQDETIKTSGTNSQKDVKASFDERIKTQGEEGQKDKEWSKGCYSIEIAKMIMDFEKKGGEQEVKQRYKGIRDLLERIKQKKEQNLTKSKQCKQLQTQNRHMKAHLKKTKQLYLQTRSNHSAFLTLSH